VLRDRGEYKEQESELLEMGEVRCYDGAGVVHFCEDEPDEEDSDYEKGCDLCTRDSDELADLRIVCCLEHNFEVCEECAVR